MPVLEVIGTRLKQACCHFSLHRAGPTGFPAADARPRAYSSDG